MKNQFIYTREVTVPATGEGQPTVKRFKDSFNINKVIRTVQLETGFLVVLDDFHEETRQAPILNKQGKFTGTKNEKNTYQSEINLSTEEGLKLLDIIGI